MATRFLLMKDINGECIYGYPFSDTIEQVTLAANTAQSFSVPENVNMVVFSFTKSSDVYVNPRGTAQIPGGSFTSTFQELNPLVKPVYPGQILSFISPTTAGVTLSFFNL
jgi:hypothetical protein